MASPTPVDLVFDEIDEMPTNARTPRESRCLQAYVAAKQSRSGMISVKPSQPGPAGVAEVTKFYRSMVQWKNRHKETPIIVKKVDGEVAVRVIREGETPPPARKRRTAQERAAT